MLSPFFQPTGKDYRDVKGPRSPTGTLRHRENSKDPHGLEPMSRNLSMDQGGLWKQKMQDICSRQALASPAIFASSRSCMVPRRDGMHLQVFCSSISKACVFAFPHRLFVLYSYLSSLLFPIPCFFRFSLFICASLSAHAQCAHGAAGHCASDCRHWRQRRERREV